MDVKLADSVYSPSENQPPILPHGHPALRALRRLVDAERGVGKTAMKTLAPARLLRWPWPTGRLRASARAPNPGTATRRRRRQVACRQLQRVYKMGPNILLECVHSRRVLPAGFLSAACLPIPHYKACRPISSSLVQFARVTSSRKNTQTHPANMASSNSVRMAIASLGDHDKCSCACGQCRHQSVVSDHDL